MDTTIRNLDESAYRSLKARAALRGVPIGQLMSEAIRAYLGRPEPVEERRSLAELRPRPYPGGCERLSEEVDKIVYGA
ncbi:MAG: hypothetical protein FJW20_11825 [Acidimicrobiia bacterium]|nr:hypothetical protein [Acidimicrobiia bacterium]